MTFDQYLALPDVADHFVQRYRELSNDGYPEDHELEMIACIKEELLEDYYEYIEEMKND